MQRSKKIRYRFYLALFQSMRIAWPILLGLMVVMAGLGAIVSFLEDWQLLEGVYFAFVTGLTVGYGDLVPHHLVSRTLAIVIGFIGVLLTALFAAISVRAMQEAMKEITSDAE